MILPKDFSAVLCRIYTQLGEDILKNPDRLVAVFTDIAPNLKSERLQLEILVKSGCAKMLAAASERSEGERSSALAAAVDTLSDTYLMDTGRAEVLCRIYLNALKGRAYSPDAAEAPAAAPAATPKEPATSASSEQSGSGTQPRKKAGSRKWIIPVILLLIIGFIGASCTDFTEALDNRDFIRAEGYSKLIPFGKAFMPEKYAYLNAGLLWEEGKYLEAWQAFEALEGVKVPLSIRNDLESKIYARGESFYQSGRYTEAKKYFNITSDYRRSSDYLLLIDSFEADFSGQSNTAANYTRLYQLLQENFADVFEVFCTNNSLQLLFLQGEWVDENADVPYYFAFYEDGSCKYNLPAEKVGGYYWFSYGSYKQGEEEATAVELFYFSIIDADTIEVDCVTDGSTHILYRQ